MLIWSLAPTIFLFVQLFVQVKSKKSWGPDITLFGWLFSVFSIRVNFSSMRCLFKERKENVFYYIINYLRNKILFYTLEKLKDNSQNKNDRISNLNRSFTFKK